LYPAYLKAAEELRDNPGQWTVYESRGNCVVLAGPGSGKTKVLTIKMTRMLSMDIVHPRGITCITYNSECARELKRRLESLGVLESKNVFIGTIHSFCLKNILMPYGKITGYLPDKVKIATSDIQNSLLALALEKVGINDPPSKWKTDVDRYRRTFIDRTAPEWLEVNTELANIIEQYEKILRGRGLIDFDDMVLLGLRLIEENEWIRRALRSRFPIFVIDEYQDLGLPLHRIVLNFLRDGVRILAVGDPDQSIYGFTGAKPELLIELSKMEEIESVRLPFNYRSGEKIVSASQIVLGEKRGYKAKGKHGGIIEFYECTEGLQEQADLICNTIIPEALQAKKGRLPGDIAILYADKNDGDIIADTATAYSYNFVRIDRNAPYNKTPLIRWMEDCASWCSGGWKLGTPCLSNLIGSWLIFNRSVHDGNQMQLLKVSLVRFLWLHRTPDLSLYDWLSEFRMNYLDDTLKKEIELIDDAEELSKLIKSSKKGGKLEKFTVATFAGQGGAPDHLNLITLHSAKGLEFDVVIMMGMDQGKIPSWAATSEKAKREPRRLFYVGLTRAKDEVHMTYSGWIANKYGRIFKNGPSEFLLELQQKLKEF
jgi:DNA helicase-2/ATP-dependent DNA helicase PcrA